MRPLFLYLENFMGFSSCELSLSSLNSAVIIGRKDGNDNRANAVGKSTIFRAIEFCVFNECAQGVKLEKIIRDDQSKCKVIFDFEIEGKIYRIVRSRTRKGVTDLSLFERNDHVEDNVNPHTFISVTDEFKKFWNDKSCRRPSDTEEELQKIHRLTYSGFTASYYFAQHDYTSGLASSTKSQRKGILKSSLNLVIYNFLLKLANTRSSNLLKEIEKKQILFNSIGDVEKDIENLQIRLVDLKNQIVAQENIVSVTTDTTNSILLELNELKLTYKNLFDQLEFLIKKRKEIVDKLQKSELLVSDFTNKRKTIIAAAKNLTTELTELKKNKEQLSSVDVSILPSLKENLDKSKHSLSEKTGLTNSLRADLVKLRIPLPDDAFCKHCRQLLTDAHRRACENSTNEEIGQKEEQISILSLEMTDLNKTCKTILEKINNVETAIKKLDALVNQINSKTRELADKKQLYNDYDLVLNKYKAELDETKIEHDKIEVEFNSSNSKELELLQRRVSLKEQELNQANKKLSEEINVFNKLNNQKAVVENNIVDRTTSLQKKNLLKAEIIKLENDHSQLPFVIEAFGPTGIPNLIIQDILDDLQIEANSILQMIHPGLQLSFSIEKTREDGQIDDDLNIDYFLNGRARDFGILSGAQQVCIMFGLKLGMAYLLKKKIGSIMNMLLMDEIDPSFDKASVDILADIIKFFQKDFTILVITHDDRLRDKFSHAILVEQDQNMTSTAKIVTSW